MILYGPFSELLPLSHLSATGPLQDQGLTVIKAAGLLVDGAVIKAVGPFTDLEKEFPNASVVAVPKDSVAVPGLIDSHTHICFAGDRAKDYALRSAGVSYLEIARQGGGILSTVKATREASLKDLKIGLLQKCDDLLARGITTCEVKSGYGLNVADELKMLNAISEVHAEHPIDLVASCLAAHVMPPEFSDHQTYLNFVLSDILPEVKTLGLAKRVDVFIEDGAFDSKMSLAFLKQAQALGFSVVVHADQFSVGGSQVACDVGALSADHLEASSDLEMKNLAKANVIATVLPGASLGLGMHFAPARRLLDHGCSVVIASDWNPGSAPMGNLLVQAAVLGVEQKLSAAELWAGLTCRAALALECSDRGQLEVGLLADVAVFPVSKHQDILYRQGQVTPSHVIKNGKLI